MSRKILYNVAFGALLLIFLYAFYVSAWVVDDAYITFRTVDNFVNGHGLTWNVAERVQSYSHPLWMLLMSVCFVFSSEFFYTSIALSAVLCVAAVVLLSLHFRAGDTPWKAPLVVLLMVCSKAVMDYSSSGLENPLSHLLVLLFYCRLLAHRGPLAKLPPRQVQLLFFVAALAFLNRMDTVLFYAPALVALALVHVRRGGIRFAGTLLLALAPAMLWLVFSTFYYGFPLPNTAYAKASHIGVPLADRFVRGLVYLQTSLIWDSASHLMIAFAAALALWRRKLGALLAVGGVVLYLLYVVTTAASATHMAGRFFSVAFVLCFVVVVQLVRTRAAAAVVAVIAVTFALVSPVSPLKLGTSWYKPPALDRSCLDTNWFVHNEGAALVNGGDGVRLPAHQWYRAGLAFRKHPGTLHVGGVFGQAIGYFGQAAGPRKHIIDNLGLADAFLARLPACNTASPKFWKSGHFFRLIPQGYVASVKYRRNLLRDPSLRRYYDKLVVVTRGPLFSWQRLAQIFQLNTGAHDHWLLPYQARIKKRYAHHSCKDDVYRRGVGLVR